MTHEKWLNYAERIDSLRIFPRLFLIACFWWAVKITWYLIVWYTHLAVAERGVEASGFGAVVLLGIMAFLKLVYTTYSDNARDWSQRAPSSTTTTVQQTTQTGGTPP